MNSTRRPRTEELNGATVAVRAASPIHLRDGDTLGVLIQRMAAGDRDAFGAFYESTVALLCSFARRVLRDPADVEEVICDAYMQAWQSAKHYNPGRGSVITWLAMICRARAIDRYRQNHSTFSIAASGLGETFTKHPETDAGPDDLLSALQKRSAIHLAIARLPPVRRRLLALAFFEDLSHSEIADATELAKGTVKSHIRRALVTLRKDLQGEGILIAL